MSLDAKELIAAIPIDIDESQESNQQSLEKLLSSLSQMPVPVSRLTRLWALGSMQARIAVAYLAYWIRSGYATRDEKERLLNETHLKAAFKLLGGMSYLRGAIMKVGQVIANYPNVAPQEFVDVLGRLQFEAPPMHFSLLREHMRNELGADPEELFDDFETSAFAAASLGQVHRARLRSSGKQVAVKIQYPNIGRTIRNDFRNMKAVALPMRLTSAWDNLLEQDVGCILKHHGSHNSNTHRPELAWQGFMTLSAGGEAFDKSWCQRKPNRERSAPLGPGE